MLDKINHDIKEAMKSKQKDRLEALRYLKSMIIENNTSKNPKDEMDVIISHCKKLRDSITSYPEGTPQIDKIKAEVQFLEVYLPKQLEESEVQDLIEQIKAKQDSPNMGAIMKELSPQIKGKFDGKKASELVKKAIN